MSIDKKIQLTFATFLFLVIFLILKVILSSSALSAPEYNSKAYEIAYNICKDSLEIDNCNNLKLESIDISTNYIYGVCVDNDCTPYRRKYSYSLLENQTTFQITLNLKGELMLFGINNNNDIF